MATGCPMMKMKRETDHPCFGGDHSKAGRIHLPVAPGCNIKCGFCERKFDCANESRPGVTSKVLTPEQAVRRVELVAKHMQKQGGGAIINISTFAAFEPDPLFPTSGVFRAGLAAFTKLFSDKYAADNIRMNNVLPGFIDSLPEKADRVARIPMGRYARVEELSEVIAFLVSDRSSYITGQNLRVDGGLTRSV